MPPGAVRIAFPGDLSRTAAQQMQPYNVEDSYVDPVPATDVWAVYLAARFSKREELYDSFSAPEKELVRKELRRIRYLREYFGFYRLSPSDPTLVNSLERAHSRWRERASKRCRDELVRLDGEVAKADKLRRLVIARDRAILGQVQLWQSQVYTEFQQQMSPVSYISGLEAADDSIDDNPREANYGYNGWLIVFEKGKGGVTVDHPLCHGRFPHQKIPVQKLLYAKKETPLKRSKNKKQLRYFHLQANNMKWVEDAISRYYGEEGSEFEGHRKSYQRRLYQHSTSKGESNTEKLLKRELWHGQERGGVDTHMPPHSRQIRPRCAIVPSPPWSSASPDLKEESIPEDAPTETYSHSSHGSQDIVLFMPYLHWEIEKRLARMTNVVRKTRQLKEQEYDLERSAKRRGTWGSVVERAAMAARAQRLNSTDSEIPGAGTGGEDKPPWRPQSPLGTYLWLASKLYQVIDEAADWRLIGNHLYTQSPLHVRRTLEQYSCWTSEDTSQRDRQQVVYRGTRLRNDPEAIPRVVMVDQLWLWILDENTIISAFPRRWGRNKPDPSAVHRAIRDNLATIDKSHINSIYDLALIIIDECSKVFFDRTKPDLRPEVVDIFGSAISNIAEKKMEAYERFGRDVKRMNAEDPLQTAEELLRKSLNIKFEWSVLMEAQNVIDQLQIMQEIFTQQITVMGDFEKALRAMSSDPTRDQEGLKSALARAVALIAEMKLRRTELMNLEKRQADARGQLRELLDMKQQQSGIIEAKAAIRRADESVLQGRSIVVFTVVTIFFLPLSFFATLFGMNAQEFNEGYMPLSTQLIYMFSISSVVIILSLAIAFSTWARTVLFGAFRFSFAYASHKSRRGKPKPKNLKAASAHTLREFMIAKQKEWESRDDGPNGLASGARLPMHNDDNVQQNRGGLFPEIAMSRLWRRSRSE
ncbi:hypothetical protein QBC34DRAFT_413143 [Podospora aff. communis PSN243]|uniref:Uncharacterized protein n=1 Tax=Podospora aff. communis PSN243 TaxID=3040156 RepID=A0AAV9GB07_9PEZI|nr:hypothetical protein QBC34DRAFT_413143 [Podospora aff. communis PSN243]